jgi:glycosyltransferase involved in cell wall biosynthesis
MKFSLIVPTKGPRVAELERMIRSLYAQTFQDFEIILSDQNPDDRIREMLLAQGWADKIIHLKSSSGASRARNVGLDRASGEILGFPDDDCTYPPRLLENIARFFETQPEYGFLTGRSFADDGEDAAARHGRKASRIRRYAIYYQCIEFALWIRRAELKSMRFDENLGTGSVTPWQSDEGPDLVLRLEEQGTRGFYDPQFAVWHPRLEQYDAKAIDRSYRYACGSGFFLRKHHYPAWFFFYLLLRSCAAWGVALLKRQSAKLPFYTARLRGMWRGWHARP